MSERVRLVQLLCGPKRHAIMGIAYEPGIAASTAAGNDIVLTEDNATAYLKEIIDDWFRLGMLNPWCSLCNSRVESWFYEDARTIFRTMEDAQPHLTRLAEAQARVVLDIASRKN